MSCSERGKGALRMATERRTCGVGWRRCRSRQRTGMHARWNRHGDAFSPSAPRNVRAASRERRIWGSRRYPLDTPGLLAAGRGAKSRGPGDTAMMQAVGLQATATSSGCWRGREMCRSAASRRFGRLICGSGVVPTILSDAWPTI